MTGTWTANSDGTYSDSTTTSGDAQFALDASCLVISGTPATTCEKAAGALTALGYSTVNCTSATGGGCACTAKVQQALSSASGAYSTSGNVVTNVGDLADPYFTKLSYCVSGNTMTWTPQSTGMTGTLTGSIVLQKQGTTGSGGAPGSGGVMGGGGATGKGGSSGASGGASGTGGRSGTGGITNSGGAAGGSTSLGGNTGTGGAASGGATAKGGATGSGGTAATGGTTGGTTGTGTAPCDIYAAASCTCVAAHSTVRALVGSYSGALYQVKRADGTTKDIPVLNGFADSSVQDAFCTSACTITKIYDQSGHGNFLSAETLDAEDTTVRPMASVTGHTAASATAETLNVGGHKVYSLYTKASQAYWRDGSKTGMPTGASPQGVYMVTSGTHYNAGCCYDYGNGETSRTYVAGPTMDAVNFSGAPAIWGSGAGNGPWIMADLEGGVFSGSTTGNNPNNPSQTAKYVTAIEKNNGTTAFALRGGDATSGALGTYYSGALPAGKNPMKKQGSIILGSGGDCCYSNSNASYGTFYEGAIAVGSEAGAVA
jgi:non-reducing end alpha-L-arabinofuranosidase